MKKIVTKKIDDLDGSPADETVQFMLDDNVYELDLTHAHAQELRALMRGWTRHARHTKPHRTGQRRNPDEVRRNQAIRAWARENGYGLRTRGRIPDAVIRAYRERENGSKAGSQG